jgi:hypothetical protein
MRLGRRSLGEEFMYGRAGRGSTPESQEPPDPKRRFNLTLRVVGIVLPLVVAYGVGLFYFGAKHNSTGFYAAKAAAAAIWIVLGVALAARRDWIGAFAVTGVYVFFAGWMWLSVQD